MTTISWIMHFSYTGLRITLFSLSLTFMFQTRNQDMEWSEFYCSKSKGRSTEFIHKQQNHSPGEYSLLSSCWMNFLWLLETQYIQCQKTTYRCASCNLSTSRNKWKKATEIVRSPLAPWHLPTFRGDFSQKRIDCSRDASVSEIIFIFVLKR